MTALDYFRQQYSRLLVLVACALQQGHNPEHVIEAARGHGNRCTPVYYRIRRQQQRSHRALASCKRTDHPQDIAGAAFEARALIEEEFMRSIPSFAPRV